jgi:transcriptional regulator with XRE-family HTH domain
MSTVIITGRHVTAARGLLHMTIEELAAAAGVSHVAITSLENAKRPVRESTIEKIRAALERRGIEFTNGNAPGVRLNPEKVVYPQ